jgi:hypothetical protein
MFFVEIVTDEYPSETSWYVMDICSGEIEIEGGGEAEFTEANTEYSKYKCLKSSENYEFVIEDSYGDGMSYGAHGSYEIEFGEDYKLTGDQFEHKEVHSFGSGSGCVQQICNGDELLFSLTLTTDYYGEETSWRLVDVCTDIVLKE